MAKKIRHHRRGHRGSSSIKTLGFAAAAGVAAVVGLGFLQTKVETVRQYWYAGPALLGVGAFALKKKMPTIAIGLAAAAGLLAYMGYQANAEATASASSSTPKQGSAGLTDAGALRRMSIRGDSGMYETGAGSLQGATATPLLRSQAAGLMGAAANAVLQSSAAGLSD